VPTPLPRAYTESWTHLGSFVDTLASHPAIPPVLLPLS